MAEALPAEPGVYRDAHGDMWSLDVDGWRHIARRMTDGRMHPVRDYPGPTSSEALAELSMAPGVDVLPLKRVEVEDVPPQVE